MGARRTPIFRRRPDRGRAASAEPAPRRGPVVGRIVEVEAYTGGARCGESRLPGQDPSQRDDVRSAGSSLRLFHLWNALLLEHRLPRGRCRRRRAAPGARTRFRLGTDAIEAPRCATRPANLCAGPVACARRSESIARWTERTSCPALKGFVSYQTALRPQENRWSRPGSGSRTGTETPLAIRGDSSFPATRMRRDPHRVLIDG